MVVAPYGKLSELKIKTTCWILLDHQLFYQVPTQIQLQEKLATKVWIVFSMALPFLVNSYCGLMSYPKDKVMIDGHVSCSRIQVPWPGLEPTLCWSETLQLESRALNRSVATCAFKKTNRPTLNFKIFRCNPGLIFIFIASVHFRRGSRSVFFFERARAPRCFLLG